MPYHSKNTSRLPLFALTALAGIAIGTALGLWWINADDPTLPEESTYSDATPFPFGDSLQTAELGLHNPLVQAAQSATGDLWARLGMYEFEEYGNYQYRVVFSDDVQALHGTEVELQGFIIPIDQGLTIKHFLLSTYPLADCQFCLPGGPEAFVEVKTEQPITFTYDPITLRGPLTILPQEEIDEWGLFYRMTNPEQVDS